MSEPSPASRATSGWLPASILVRQLLLYLLLIALLAGGIGLLLFRTARGHLEAEVGRKLESVAAIAAEGAPWERLELIREGDDGSRMVLRLEQRLEQIQRVTNADNIYVLRADGTWLLDLRDQVPIGRRHALPQLTPDLLARLQAGAPAHTPGYQAGGPDILMSAFAPVMDGGGRLAAIVGVDAGTRELAVVDRMRRQLAWIALAGALVGVVLAVIFARSITSPIRDIARTAARLGRGDYSARARVTSGDEVSQLAAAVNRMAEQVRQRDAALKELGASVAHEIRNPLNSIQLLLSLLQEQLAPPAGDVAETLRTLRYEIGKLDRLIDEFLTYSRPLTLMRDEVAVADLLAGVVDMAAAEARERGVRVEWRAEHPLPAVLGDQQRLEQALLNIALNGIQATPAGGQVVVRAGPDPAGGVELVVEDSGPGLAADLAERAFEPFFTTKSDGTGLGLANARKIAEQHGGTLRSENRREGGARFVLRLPPPPRKDG